VAEGLEQAEQATRELRDLVHGIPPRVLTVGGLRPAVIALAARMTIPVGVDVWIPRVDDSVEGAAYFVVAEALTNVAKHAGATRADVRGRIVDGMLRVAVCDDGAGGARPDGRGLLGLADRLAVLQGRLTVDSPARHGTTVSAVIPIAEIVTGARRGRGSVN
jgi:signal transduction histidine kinase